MHGALDFGDGRNAKREGLRSHAGDSEREKTEQAGGTVGCRRLLCPCGPKLAYEDFICGFDCLFGLSLSS
jgi:hypothetical protein